MKPGVYRGLSETEYAAIPAVRSSVLREFAKATPAHWRYAEEQIAAEPRWAPEGRALHLAAFQPDIFSRCVASRRAMPSAKDLGCYSSTGKAGFWTDDQKALRDSTRAEIERECEGYEIVLEPDEMERVTAMADVLHADPDFRELIELPHEAELTIVWEDEETGFPCKARLDLWVPKLGVIVELKGTKEVATVERFSREILRYGYHQQAAWYLEAAQAELQDLRSSDPLILAVSEKAHPHLCAVRPMEFGALVHGRNQMQDALRRFAECKRTNHWPSHDSAEAWELPGWASPKDIASSITFPEQDLMEGF